MVRDVGCCWSRMLNHFITFGFFRPELRRCDTTYVSTDWRQRGTRNIVEIKCQTRSKQQQYHSPENGTHDSCAMELTDANTWRYFDGEFVRLWRGRGKGFSTNYLYTHMNASVNTHTHTHSPASPPKICMGFQADQHQ